jgi:S-adenosyl methyltransferase
VAPRPAAQAPNLARMYDWLLGGSENEEVDRVATRRLTALVPDARAYAVVNRQFTARALRVVVDAEVRGFVDIGAGLPTMGAVPQVLDELAPHLDAHAVLVDNDPAAVSRAAQLLAGTRHTAVEADLLAPRELWATVLGTGLVDPAEPVCLLLTAWLHFVKDASGLAKHLAYLRDRLAPGSFVVLTHSTDEGAESSSIRPAASEFHGDADPGQLRGSAELRALLGDFEPLAPGIVHASRWRPDSRQDDPFAGRPEDSHTLAVVARRPGRGPAHRDTSVSDAGPWNTRSSA